MKIRYPEADQLVAREMIFSKTLDSIRAQVPEIVRRVNRATACRAALMKLRKHITAAP